MKWLGHEVDVADPLASPEEIRREYGLEVQELGERRYDLVIGAVPHREYREMDALQLGSLLSPGGTLADLKAIWRDRDLPENLDRWSL